MSNEMANHEDTVQEKDHDLLIRVAAGMLGIEDKIDRVILDHENRLRDLEKSNTQIRSYGPVIAFLIGILTKIFFK